MEIQNIKVTSMKILAVVAIFLGIVADLWFLGLIDQWLIPWSSLGWLRA
jgi:hypothetical protein